MIAVQGQVDSCGALLARLGRARAQTDALFEIVRPDSLYDRPIPERHRIVFYIGHLEAFDRNLSWRRFAGIAPVLAKPSTPY
jgi:hypothetical protein